MNPRTKKIIKNTLKLLLGCFVLYLAAEFFVFVAVNHGWTNTKGMVDSHFNSSSTNAVLSSAWPAEEPGPWVEGEEWQTFKEAIVKDQELINQAARVTGVPARLIMVNVAVEQLRLYHSDREIFKKFFSPLKILGNEIQFSWGVAGFKQATAEQVEDHLLSQDSPYYLGPEYTHILDYATTTPRDEALFNRLTDDDNHYYSYLYTALYLKQVTSQWQRAGYNIDNRPEITSTLFNIGFNHSEPKPNPLVGGAEIEIRGRRYSFGGLAYEIYYSNELLNEFPRQ